MSKAPPESKLGRSALTGLALAHAGASRLGHKARHWMRKDTDKAAAQDAHEAELGRILFRTLNQLKGSALKISQMLSLDSDFLPPGVRRELAKGCHQVTPLNRALIHKVFQREFGKAPEQLYAQFEPLSFAAASLGQVHHARTHEGQMLAVKVQYPGIAATVTSDIRMLRTMLTTLGLGNDIMPRKDVVDSFVGEMEIKLMEELDYLHEAAQLNWFRQHCKLPGIAIPRTMPTLSSARVLSMEQLDGLHLDAWLASNPDQAQRDHFGQLLFDWFWYCVCELGYLHADPHPGNFMFMPDGRLAVLDFGCTKAMSPEFCSAMADSWRALLLDNETERNRALRLAYVDLHLLSPDLSQDRFDHEVLPVLQAVQDWKIQCFRTERFDFTHQSPYPVSLDQRNNQVLAQVEGYHPDMPYFDRAYLGLIHMLKSLGAVVNTGMPWVRNEGIHQQRMRSDYAT
ncbi:AarF/ABC1/UbiB kinase family protein [Undibacterium sp. CY7W]|uniref:AarF/ABC1/UbiB kinase family protein n=1 Tax=Undibacterium rugosum TaxID=2762291 RepID=A0A923KYX5_9BURK|nr:AarF/ABC1/UbiB kinase family protein [Undibacterium rugosum]MBC3935058.1 AarF/ABC1/UbiB kinase family protein [Undibacterium rugosum]